MIEFKIFDLWGLVRNGRGTLFFDFFDNSIVWAQQHTPAAAVAVAINPSTWEGILV